MMKAITISEIAGYMTEKSVWRLILFLSKEWQKSPALSNKVDGNTIGVADDEFVNLATATPCQADEPTAVWTLGAWAFYGLMGVPVLDGNGQKNQTATTEIPHISDTHGSKTLDDIIHRSLSYDATKRPTMQDIHVIAEQQLKTKVLPKRRLANSKGKSYKKSLVSFWPEEMVSLLILMLMLLMPHESHAQGDIPKEMATIVERCKLLRTSNNQAKVSREFLYDTSWTLMDEIDIDKKGECTMKDKVSTFGINEMGYRIAKRQGGVTNAGGRFRNGQDSRYNYSFIEVTVKKGMTVSYEITGRQGIQQFAVLPYQQGAAFSVSVTQAGQSIASSQAKDGVSFLKLKKKVTKNEVFRLSIKNNSGKNMAFVIVNYNPWK